MSKPARTYRLLAAGCRPCAVCLPERYAAWKTKRDLTSAPDATSSR